MVSFRSARKIRSYLVKAKFYPLHRKVSRNKRAKNRCKDCDYVTDTDIFTNTSTATGETFKINNQSNFDDRCIIYLLKCKQYQKQSTGETTDGFR